MRSRHKIAAASLVALAGLAMLVDATPAALTASVSGGFLEKAGSPTYRARFTAAQMASFLPAGGVKGRFTFPAPYGTEAVRLTDATDCADGQDCVWYVGYSYWRTMNNHVGSDTMLILLGFDRERGGAGPSLLAYDKRTDQVQNLGPLFSAQSVWSFAAAEGWYFSALVPTRLYAFLPGSAVLRRFDVAARQFEPAPALDLNLCPRPAVCPADAAFIYQPHSSDDDAVHSATVQSADFRRLGCIVSRAGGFVYVPTRDGYSLDECHLDKSGRWLIVLETGSGGALDNRIIDASTGAVTAVSDFDGALGHLDTGLGYAVGADNYNPLPNASILLTFPLAGTARPLGPVVHFNKRWDIAAANHITHGNAVPGSPDGQFACGSNASRVLDMADEIVCFSLNPDRQPDGSLDVLVVGQVMTDLDAPGGGAADYGKMPKGNLDVTGRYFMWTANLGGNRLDAFLVKVPGELLTGPGGDPPVTLHVGDLDGSAASLGRGRWRGTVAAQVHDDQHRPVAGAAVSAAWSGGYSGSASCITDSTGRCSVTTANLRNDAGTVTLAVAEVRYASLPYGGAFNHDPDGDSDGTAVTVRKP